MTTEFITKPTMSLVQRMTSNKHTSIAAIVYVGAKYGVKFGEIWLPTYKAQFDQTADLIESAALAYGFVMAGDSQPKKVE